MPETAHFRDFSRKRLPVYFVIDGEEFHCRKALGAELLQDAMIKFKDAHADGGDITAVNVLEKISDALEILMFEESHARFMAAVKDRQREEPIELGQLTEIFQWLIERYTARPTEALPDSSNSSETDNAGTDSPAGVQLPESTPSI
jgi:hypothetical protein